MHSHHEGGISSRRRGKPPKKSAVKLCKPITTVPFSSMQPWRPTELQRAIQGRRRNGVGADAGRRFRETPRCKGLGHFRPRKSRSGYRIWRRLRRRYLTDFVCGGHCCARHGGAPVQCGPRERNSHDLLSPQPTWRASGGLKQACKAIAWKDHPQAEHGAPSSVPPTDGGRTRLRVSECRNSPQRGVRKCPRAFGARLRSQNAILYREH